MLGVGFACVLVVAWEAIGHLGLYNVKLLPPPSEIVSAFLRMVRTGEWTSDVEASLSRYFVGLIIGAILGVCLGFATGRVRIIYNTIAPLMNFLRSTPSIALVPLSIVLLGIGEVSKDFVIAWGVTFPVWIGTHTGMRQLTTAYDWAARSLGARKVRILAEVLLPEALPHIMSGIRIGIATGFFALAAAEMAGASSGVAYRIFAAQQGFQTDEMMVAILTIGALGLIADVTFAAFAKRVAPWWKNDDFKR
jgi:ABC-type nitrate/sulfonate/bicarbonate transport system permease component